MLIVNADDWGRSRAETDAAMTCHAAGAITSVSAMVFMEDSVRAAELAKQAGIDVGLHLNLSQPFTDKDCPGPVVEKQKRIIRFLRSGRYAPVLYNPFLRSHFREIYHAQMEQFRHLYGRRPSHIDGHQHMHLCANIWVDGVIAQCETVRRNFSFRPGEKARLNRVYRAFVDRQLKKRYRLTDYFFDLASWLDCKRLAEIGSISKSANVELMTHPVRPRESDFLKSEDYRELIKKLPMGTYAQLPIRHQHAQATLAELQPHH